MKLKEEGGTLADAFDDCAGRTLSSLYKFFRQRTVR